MSRLLPLLAAGEPDFTPSNYMPSLRVEIAFTSGYNTPDADRVWTDVSEWVELGHGITDTFGRQDERSVADANDLTLTLDNSDGRFTAGRAASPYYPNVKIGRPIRLSLMTVTGYTSVRFVGFVNQWPVEWDGTDAYAKATVTAGSRLSRLGLSHRLRSMIEQEILSYGPRYYYTLGEPTGATMAQDSSGNNEAALSIATTYGGTPGPNSPTFGSGTGPGSDGLPAVQFPADSYPLEQRATPSATTWMTTFNVASSGSVVYLLRVLGSTASFWVLSAEISAAGTLLVKNLAGTTLVTGPTVTDGSTHFLMMSVSGGSVFLYLDGDLVGSAATATPSAPARLLVGGVVGTPGVTMSHVAGLPAEPTAPEISDLSNVTLTGAAGDTTDERLTRILGWAGVPAAEISTQAGAETMTYQQTDGMSVVDALRDVESTEGGVLFDGPDGRVTFHNRAHRYTAPVAVTFDMAEQQVEADYAPKLDRSTLVNTVRVENSTTGWTADVADAASVEEYGTVTGSSKALTDTYPPLVQKAWWLVASYAEPRPRVPSLTVDVLAQVGGTPSAEDILALTIGSRIKVINQPTQADATTADYFVEGYTEAIGPESYRITFNLSPGHPSLSVVVLDDPDRGLDSGSILGL